MITCNDYFSLCMTLDHLPRKPSEKWWRIDNILQCFCVFWCVQLHLLVDLQRMDIIPALHFILARVGKGVNGHIVFVPWSGGGRGRGGVRERRERTQTEVCRHQSKEENHVTTGAARGATPGRGVGWPTRRPWGRASRWRCSADAHTASPTRCGSGA